MAKINATQTVQQLRTQFTKVSKKASVKISDLPRGKLKSLAQLVANKTTVGTGCSTSSVSAPTITTKKLKSAIDKVAADLKKNDKNKDSFLPAAEAKGLSQLSKDLLNLDTDGSAIVATGC